MGSSRLRRIEEAAREIAPTMNDAHDVESVPANVENAAKGRIDRWLRKDGVANFG